MLAEHLELDVVGAVLPLGGVRLAHELPGLDHVLRPQLGVVAQGDGGGLLGRQLPGGVEDRAQHHAAPGVEAGPPQGGDEDGGLVRLRECRCVVGWGMDGSRML